MRLTTHVRCTHCFMMDDSVRFGRGVTLQSDPHPRWTQLPSNQNSKSEPTSLRQVLEFIEDTGFADRDQFGGKGFMRYRGDIEIKKAHSRRHVTSAVFWNVGLLNQADISFNKDVHIGEDLDMNLQTEDAGIVLCKCYRFAQYKIQISSGGCSWAVARPEGKAGESAGAPLKWGGTSNQSSKNTG